MIIKLLITCEVTRIDPDQPVKEFEKKNEGVQKLIRLRSDLLKNN